MTGHHLLPYFDEACLYKENWRGETDDVVLSTGAKSGTVWLQTIVMLLSSNGWDDFEDMSDYYGRCEFMNHPDETMETRRQADNVKRQRNKDQGIQRFQIFSHKFPGNGKLFGMDPTRNRNVRYIAIVRNGKEVVRSFMPFVNAHTEKIKQMWGGFPPEFKTPEETLKFFVDDLPELYFGHLLAWWQRKDEPNVLLIHYANLRRDPATVIRQIAEFLEISLTDQLLTTVLHKTSLEYMSDPSRTLKYRGPRGVSK